MNKALFSSDKTTWETPQDLFDRLNAEHGFTVDVCALPHNAKHANYFTPDIDGLKQKWEGVCWMNPPYGRQVIGKWIEKAYKESQSGSCKVVALLPARTDTKWFHNWIYKKGSVKTHFLKGRVKFVGAESGAPFPSMIVVFNP